MGAERRPLKLHFIGECVIVSFLALVISLLRNGLTLAGIKGDATVITIGAVLIIAVFINRLFYRQA